MDDSDAERGWNPPNAPIAPIPKAVMGPYIDNAPGEAALSAFWYAASFIAGVASGMRATRSVTALAPASWAAGMPAS